MLYPQPPSHLTPAASVPIFEPAYQPIFHGSDRVQSIVFAPDRPVLYALTHVQTANPWPALVSLWPEIFGGALFLITIAASLIVRRIIRRPQTFARPHCRSCSYDLTGQTTAAGSGRAATFTWAPNTRCPECGAQLDKTPPIRGRRLGLRLVPVLAIWLCLAAGYGALFATTSPRLSPARNWFDLSSVWAANNAAGWLKWLSLTPQNSDHIVEIDLATGELLRTIATRGPQTYFDLAISPDGRALFVSGRENQCIDAISTVSGNTIGTGLLPGTPSVGVLNPAVLGFSSDGTVAYVQWSDFLKSDGGVVAWAWNAGRQTTPLIHDDGFVSGGQTHTRRFYFRDHRGTNGAPRFLSILDSDGRFNSNQFPVSLYERKLSTERFEVTPLPGESQYPAISRDGSRLYLGGNPTAFCLREVNLDERKSARLAGVGSLFSYYILINRAGNYLFTNTLRELVGLTTADLRHALTLKVPRGLSAWRWAVSPDDHFVAAISSGRPKNPQTPADVTHSLVIWNLGAGLLTETPTPTPPPTPSPPPTPTP